MNLLAKFALLFGRKKFEEFAQANPALPDDALAVANTLDTFPVRGAVTLVAGSLAHALDNLLRGTETIDAAATHALLILAALCIVWVRHAISKHDVRVNDVVQKARDLSGIGSQTLPMILAFGLGFALFAVSPSASAQTNAVADNTFSQLVTDIGKSTKFSSGIGINLHAKTAPLLSQELPLFGHTGTNSSWSTGPSHATFFLPAENSEQLGWSLSGSWKSPPRLLRLALFNATDVDWTVNWGLPVEDYYQLFRHADWKQNRIGLSVTRKFLTGPRTDMNELHNINWGAVLAFVALLEFMRSVVIYMFISPLRGAGKKIDHLENQLNGLNFTNLQKSVEDHEKRMRTLESDAMPIDDFQRYVDLAERDRRLMNKKLDILLQRTAHLRNPEDERELADET